MDELCSNLQGLMGLSRKWTTDFTERDREENPKGPSERCSSFNYFKKMLTKLQIIEVLPLLQKMLLLWERIKTNMVRKAS